MNETSRLSEAQTLRRRGMYKQAITLLTDLTPSQDRLVLHLSCLLDQGRVRAAHDLVSSPAWQTLAENKRLAMWAAFTKLYESLGSAPSKPWESLRNQAKQITKDAASGAQLKVEADDLLSRAEALLLTVGERPLSVKTQIADQMGKVAQAYKILGLHEAFTTRRRQANLLRRPPFADREQARVILQHVKEQAQTAGNTVEAAEAHLALAEMLFEDFHDAFTPEADMTPVVQAFERAGQLFNDAEHASGEARVLLSFGQLLLRYGSKEGVPLVHQAIEALSDTGHLALQQAGWRDLNTWHTRFGDHEAALAAREASARLDNELGHDLSTDIDALTQADRLLRRGRIAEVREALKIGGTEQSAMVLASKRIILSNLLANTGLTAEAIDVLEETIDELTPQGPHPLLGDAWFLLANHLTGPEALAAIDQAIQADKDLGDTLAEGQHTLGRAWLKVQQRRLAKQQPFMTAEVESDFDAALALLQPLTTLEGRSQLGTLCERRGQATMMEERWDDCGHWFTQAETLYRELELKPSLAFTLTYQGLVLIEIARRVGLETYEKAKERFKEAERLLTEAGLEAERWRNTFFQGLVESEAGRWETSDKQKERWDEANELFLSAARQLDQLRSYASHAPAAEQQTAWMGFALGKQTVYEAAFDLAFSRHDHGAALSWLERMKGRALLDALAETVVVPEALAAQPLIQQERALRKQKSAAKRAAEAMTIQDAIDEALEALTSDPAAAGYADLRLGRPPSYAQMRALLQAEAQQTGKRLVIAQLACRQDRLYLFGLRADWDTPKVTRLDVDYPSLESIVNEHFRKSDGVRLMVEDYGDALWQPFKGLIVPLADWSREGDPICLIPHGLLHDLPLHCLRLEGQVLAERNPIFYSPSLAVLQHTLGRPSMHTGSGPSPKVAVFGDARDNLPQAHKEAVRIADSVGGALSLKDEVTQTAVLKALTQADVVHIAGHGEASASDGLESGLYVAHGVLRARELLGLRTQADLVVLSGCETGVSEQRVGDELVGLVRALLYAGAGALLVSQWRVDDDATQALLSSFYAHAYAKPSVSKAEALQRAMTELRATPAWQDLYHWGGFTLIGDWK